MLMYTGVLAPLASMVIPDSHHSSFISTEIKLLNVCKAMEGTYKDVVVHRDVQVIVTICADGSDSLPRDGELVVFANASETIRYRHLLELTNIFYKRESRFLTFLIKRDISFLSECFLFSSKYQ